MKAAARAAACLVTLALWVGILGGAAAIICLGLR
jgi:hypothetical protein